MADRGVEYGIRITADGKVAIAESAKVEKALDGVAQALDHVEASATQAQPAIGATMKQFAPQPAAEAAKALDGVAQALDHVEASATQAQPAIGATMKQLAPQSAAQTSAALRQLPMQFTDIFTSLAAGMPPMQVALQQGGQLKDAFGGIGPAAKAMGGYVMGLVTPLTVAAAGAGVLAMAFLKGRDESEEYRKTLALTGNVAGVTADQLAQMAARLDVVSGTQASNANILTRLASTGQVAKGQIEGVAGAISAMTEAGISDADALVKAFADIGKDPVKAILKVNEAYNFLTPTIYGQIKALQEQGKQEEAVALAQETAARAMKERARDVVEQAGTLERAWKGVTTSAREAWDAMLSIGREKTLQQKIADQKKVIDDIREGVIPGRIDMAQDYLAQLEAQATAQQKAAQAGADGAKNMREYLDVESKVAPIQKKGAEQTRSLAEALKEYRDNLARVKALDPNSALLDPAKVAAGEAALREQYKPKTTGTRSARKDQPDDARVLADWERRVALLDAQAAGTDKLSDTERAYVRLLSDITSGHLKVTVAGRQRLAVDAARALAQDEANRQAAEQAKWSEALAKDTTRQTAQLEEQLKREQEQVAAIGLTKDAVERLAAERLRNEAAAKAEYAANLELAAQYAGPLADAYRAAAEEARKQADLLNQRAENRVEGANREAAAATAKSWQKIGDDIERALTDSLYRGFESGKGFGTSFVDSLRNTLKTAALKAAVQLIISPVSNGLGGLLGQAASGSTGATPLGAVGSGGLLSNGLLTLGGSSLLAGTGLGGFMTGFGTAGLSGASTLGSIEAGMSLMGVAGGGAAGAGMIAGAVAPWALGALLVAQSLGAFNGSTPHRGGAYTASTSGAGALATNASTPGFNLSWGAYRSDRSGELDNAMQTLASNMAKSLSAYGQFAITSRFASDNDDWSEGAIRIADAAGKVVAEVTKRYTADANKALQDFSADTGRAMLAALQKVQISPEIDAMLDGLDPMKSGIEQITSALQAAAAWGPAGEALAASIDSAFLEPSQQLEKTFARLGLAVPATAESFAALVRAQNLNSTAGRTLAASLMEVYGQWKQVEDAAQAAAGAIAGERLQLEQQLLQAQGDAAELRARELAQLDPSNRAIQERIWALEDESRIIAEREGLDLRLLQAQGNTAQLRARELAQLDPSNRAIQERVWALEDEASAASTAADASRAMSDAARAMSDMWSGIYSDAADGIAESASAMLESLDNAAQRERTRLTAARDAASEAVTSVRSVLDLLAGSMARLYGSVDATAVMQAADAMSLISGAAAGGYMPSQDELSAAISAAQAGMSGKVYASQVDADRDRLVLAGQLSKIQTAGAAQLPVAERALKAATDQLSALDKSVELYRDQLNELRGIRDVSVDIGGTIEEVGARLVEELRAQTASFAQSVIGAVQAGRLGTGVAATQLAGAGVETDQFSQVGGQSVYLSSRGALYTSSDNTIRTNNGWAGSVEDARTIVAQTFASSSPADFYAAAVKVGLSGAMIEEMYQMPKGTAAEWARANNLPAFAVGTDYVPNDMLALVHQGERITPAPYSGQQERLLEALIAEVKSLRATLAAVAAETRRTANAVNGNPDAPMLVETV